MLAAGGGGVLEVHPKETAATLDSCFTQRKEVHPRGPLVRYSAWGGLWADGTPPPASRAVRVTRRRDHVTE